MVRHYEHDEIPSVYNFFDGTVPSLEIRDGVEQQIFRGVQNMVGATTLHPGCEVGPHSHPWEQITYILEGACDFHVGDEVVEVSEGDVLLVPPDVDHYADPNDYDEPVVNFDTWPVREGYLPRTEYQTEFRVYDHE